MVTLINSFEVPAGREDEFFALWKKVNDYMRAKPGYIGHKLHRAIAPDTRFRFVNVARWESLAHFQNSHDDGFRAMVSDAAWQPFKSHPVLFEVADEAEADDLSNSTGAS